MVFYAYRRVPRRCTACSLCRNEYWSLRTRLRHNSSGKTYLRECMTVVCDGSGRIMKAREGDLIEAIDGNIFDVKGLVHPSDRVIAFIRFTPEPNGDRRKGETHYRKVYALHERYELLKRKFPQYLLFDSVFSQWLCEVPTEAVRRHYEPAAYLSQLRRKSLPDELEKQALELAQLLHIESGVRWSALGISGSLLGGLHTPKSDIDIIVYGSKSCRKVYNTLSSLVRCMKGNLKSYREQDLKELFDFRSKDTIMRFEDFVRTESRKLLQGKFHERNYYIRCVKAWSEVSETYGMVRYKSAGEAKLRATVTDDSEMIFTPCTYQISDTQVLEGKCAEAPLEIVSFRGRFCEQARKGEEVVARGMVESVKTRDAEHFRLLIGNKPSDCMIQAR